MAQCGSNKRGGVSYGKGGIYMPIGFTARLSQVPDSRERPPRLNLYVIVSRFNYYNSETTFEQMTPRPESQNGAKVMDKPDDDVHVGPHTPFAFL